MSKDNPMTDVETLTRLENYADDLDHTERPADGDYDVTADIRKACSIARAHIEAREGVGELVERLRNIAESKTGMAGTAMPAHAVKGRGRFAPPTPADTIEGQAADTLTALQSELAALKEDNERLKAERLKQIDYGIDLQRIIEDLCHEREIREPQTTARHHYDMAVAARAALGKGEAK